MGYKVQYSGPVIDEALRKAITTEFTINGCVKLQSTSRNPYKLNNLIAPGYYSIDYYTLEEDPVTHVVNPLPFTHKPLLIFVAQDQFGLHQIVEYIGEIYSCIQLTDIVNGGEVKHWSPWKQYTGSTPLTISNSAPDPAISSDYSIWLDITEPTRPLLKICVNHQWIEYIPNEILRRSVYDPRNKNTDIFKYIDDAIAKIGGSGSIDTELAEHVANTVIHVTQAEKDSWNAKVTTTDITTAFNAIDAAINQYVTDKANELSADTTTLKNNVTTLENSLSLHVTNNTIHPSPDKQAEWNGKASGTHTHLLDGNVQIDASKVVSGQFAPERMPDDVYLKVVQVANDTERFALTSSQVHFGDTVYVESSLNFYYVIDINNLNIDIGYKLYSTAAASNMAFANISGKPNTIAGYGITDVYTKTEVDSNVTIINTSIASVRDSITSVQNELNTINSYLNNTDLATLKTTFTSLEEKVIPLLANLETIVNNSVTVQNNVNSLYSLCQ